MGHIEALSIGLKGDISNFDFSDDGPGAEFILTRPPPAVAAGACRTATTAARRLSPATPGAPEAPTAPIARARLGSPRMRPAPRAAAAVVPFRLGVIDF